MYHRMLERLCFTEVKVNFAMSLLIAIFTQIFNLEVVLFSNKTRQTQHFNFISQTF